MRAIPEIIQSIEGGGYDAVQDKYIQSIPRRWLKATREAIWEAYHAAEAALSDRASDYGIDNSKLCEAAIVCAELMHRDFTAAAPPAGAWWPECLPDDKYAMLPAWKRKAIDEGKEAMEKMFHALHKSQRSRYKPAGLRPTYAERKAVVLRLVNELPKDPKGRHASVKQIIKELRARGHRQRPQKTREILKQLKDEENYNGLN